MDMPIAHDLPLTGIDIHSLPPDEGEWVLRRQLAAAYRLVDYFGWTELIYGHLTARVPGEQAALPDQPVRPELRRGHGLEPGQDRHRRQRRRAEPAPGQLRRLRHPLGHPHGQCRAPQGGDAHPHPRRHGGLRPEGRPAADLDGRRPPSTARLAYHDYEGPSLELDERGRLLASLGENQAMMLRNHGLLVTGRSVPEAFLRLYRLERACQIQIDAAAAGTLNLLGDNLASKSGADMDRFSELESRRASATSNSARCCASSTRPIRAGGTESKVHRLLRAPRPGAWRFRPASALTRRNRNDR